ncbi:hypothetical protein B4U79_12939 [Dinothrombium tinctorium]|uniref:Hemicentin-1-like protein n=1 Tax=Dinothrombium tinctorium TaxID=1965070 RepID=A0A3S3PK78_9ACAR|nr:hypothetical protein B4U79_12939 [Dinothrombium tinctorium]
MALHSDRELRANKDISTTTIAQSSRPGVVRDALEDDTIHLECRFNPNQISKNENEYVFYWKKTNNIDQDVVTVNHNTLVKGYSLMYSIREGKYDLVISAAKYERDNGKFECKIKENGSGREVENAVYTLTILIPPGPPQIHPANPVAKEGEPFQLTCSSVGGSPDPIINWYKDDFPLEAEIEKGGSKDKPTKSILTINPTINDNRAVYKCVVWNRAVREEGKKEDTVLLTVHYVPRVKVGPANPLNVLVGSDATMNCVVDANPPAKKINWFKNDRILSHKANHTIVGVMPTDSGLYSCIADNGIKGPDGSPGRGDLELSVQFDPTVTVINEEEAVIGESVTVKCNVHSNPKPHTIIWTKDANPQVIQEGDVLRLERISAADSGRYTCTATNTLRPTGNHVTLERSGNASVNIRVKHRPGNTEILPANPIAVSGKPFTLSCIAKPPGWPVPEYKWWREGQHKEELGRQQNYTFISIHVRNEGNYYCQPYNALGTGSVSSVYLTVQEPPSITIPMPPKTIRKQGDKGFSLTCRARGKPRPVVSWYHNGEEINLDNGLFRVETSETIEDANVYVLQTVLHFDSITRRDNLLTAADRGSYMCAFDNGIGPIARAESYLKIEHSPVLMHTHKRVAFDVGEVASLQCKMSAYPEPKFEWLFKNKHLDYFGNRYSTNVTEQPPNSDIYVATLTILETRPSDYGDYTCRAMNSIADYHQTNIKLVEKSQPDSPTMLEVLEVLSDSVTLRWKEGFNGGFSNTEFIVTYYADGERWRNESCRTMNPCKITGLESRTEYRFKVLAVNPRGYSSYSEEIREVTKVNLKDMPNAYDSHFESDKNILIFNVEQNALKLVAKIEAREGDNDQWSLLTTVPILNQREKVLLRPPVSVYSDMRIILCLESNDSWCGYSHLVKIDAVSSYLKESKVFSFEHLMLVICVGGSLAVVVVIFLVCCCYKKKADVKKDYEAESDDNRPKVSAISPPYYSGHDNKGLVNGNEDPSKTSPPPMYTSNGSTNGHIPQNYYLTGDGAEPSPNGSNETAQSDVWMMKADGMSDNALPYHPTYGSAHSPIDPNVYPYSYYPHEEYQPLSEETYNMNMKNALCKLNALQYKLIIHLFTDSPYYDDGHNAYGSTTGPPMMSDSISDQHMLSQDISKINHISFDDETDYAGSRNGRPIREIIV